MKKWIWLVPIFGQHAGAGALTALIVRGEYGGVFLAAVAMQGLWWINMGYRLEANGCRRTAWLYCLVSALGVSTGAWFWR